MSNNNPFGIMNSGTYNYFAHIRSTLFPEETVSLRKRLTYVEYIEARFKILEEMKEIEKDIDRLNKLHSNTQGLDGLKYKISLDRSYLRLRLMRDAVQLDRNVSELFEISVANAVGPVSFSFSKLISYGVTSVHRVYFSNNEAKRDANKQIKWLKDTFNDEYLTLRNRNI